MKRLFGTDGIRGIAGESPLTAPEVRRFGAALAEVVSAGAGRPCRVLLGRDTRESGTWLRDAVADGLSARGAAAVDVGVITTPGLAFLLRAGGHHAAVMISASHNPYRDNGLKVFGADGFKLPDEQEQRIERSLLDGEARDVAPRDGPLPLEQALVRSYVEFLETVIGPAPRLRGLRLALDCANGAASALAPEVFRHHGAELHCLGDRPDGRNINLDCGSLHMERLARTVREADCDLGLALDGDADRCLAVDRQGRVVDGDHILYIVGRRMHRCGALRGDAVVATVMSNLWLEQRLGDEGVALRRAPVGDKYVLERMLAEDLVLGGEQSGHVIFREHATTGDGILTGLLLLDALLDDAEPLERIVDGIVPCPQVLLAVAVRAKPPLREHARIGPAIADVETRLGRAGRVVLRYSGTEPVARVMVEGADAAVVRRHAEELAHLIEEELGP